MSAIDRYLFPTPSGGLLLSSGPAANGNMVGCTAMYMFLRCLTAIGGGPGVPEGVLRFDRGLGDCQKPRGLYTADTGGYIPLEIDDFLCIACFDPDPVWKQRSGYKFRFRFQGAWQHLKIAAGIPVFPLGRFIWALSIFLAARKPFSVQDSWIESHLMILNKSHSEWKSWIGDLAVRYWRRKKCLKMGLMTTAQIYADYVGPDCADHPLIEAWKPYS